MCSFFHTLLAMSATTQFPSFSLADANAMPRRPVVNSELLDGMRYVEVTGVSSPLSSRDIVRLLPGLLEWRFLNNTMRTDIIALMSTSVAARDIATRINGHTINNSVLKATVSDRWPASSDIGICDRLSHLKELRSGDNADSSVLFYSLPRDSAIEAQRRLGLAFAAKNETVGVSSTRWVDSREAF